jgi:Cu+-exporting ATPase
LLLGEATVGHDQLLIGPRSIIEKIQKLGYNAQLAASLNKRDPIRERAEREMRKLRRQFLFAFAASVPTFLISMVIMMWLPETNPVRMAFHTEIVPGLDIGTWILFFIATFVQLYLAAGFYVKAYRAIYYARAANMATLVAIGTTAAYAGSIVNVILAMVNKNESDGQQFFETSIFLIMFVLLGKWMEAMAKGKTYETITKLMDLQPEKATLVDFTYDKEHGEIEVERDIDLALVQGETSLWIRLLDFILRDQHY